MAKTRKIVDYTTFNAIETPNSTDAKKANKGYNWSAVPKKDRWTQPHYYHDTTAQVDIGEADPVDKFKEWNGNYWELDHYKKDREKREDKGENPNNARVLP